MTAKTLLIPLLLTCLGAPAQLPPAPGFGSNLPSPGPGVLATNRDDALRQARQALRRNLEANTNGASRSLPRPALPAAAPAVPTGAAEGVVPAAAAAALPPAAPAANAAMAQPSAAAAAAHPAANAAPEEMLPPGMIDFRKADLTQVLEVYSMLVNRTLLKPSNLPAPTIDLKTQGKLTLNEGITALKEVLQLNGIGIIEEGDKFAKVLPQAQLNLEAAPFDKATNSAQLADLGQYVSKQVQLRYVKPSEIMPILQPFAKLPNSILAVEGSQMLVLRDNSENVKRMMEMIEQVDVAVPSEYISEVIPIKYALSSDIANALNSLSGSGGGGSVGSTGTATSRGATTSRMSSRVGGASMGGAGAGLPGATQPGGIQAPQAAAAQPAAGGNTYTARLQNLISRAAGSQDIQIIGTTKIISDERTNSLLVWASREDMKVIRDIIAKLDIVLAQVLIEAVIIQVSLNESANLGVSYMQNTPSTIGKWSGIGAGGAGNFLSPGSFANGVGTNGAAALKGGFNYLLGYGQDLDVTIQALEANSHAKILQRPRIQTSNAKQASLFVGQSRPYPTGSYYGGGSYGSYSSIQQLQIGVSIDVTPLINVDGLVVMDIHQKIDSFEGNVTIQGVGDVPITSSKEAQASVAVRDHDTIMLGGLIETDKSKSKSGVPLLMDLPLLGGLFRSTSSTEARSELIVLIRPTVLPTPEVASKVLEAEESKMTLIRRMEKDVQAEESKRQHQMQNEDRKTGSRN